MSLSHRTEAQALSKMNGALAEKVIVEGDLSKLTSEERVMYYNRTCESLGLNPFTRPFEYIKLQGKLVLYARKDCTEQLRSTRKISITSLDSKIIDGVYIVTACAAKSDGQEDVATGAVTIKGLVGDGLANAFMKAETKAKRRVTLSICGMGFMDESEIETVHDAKKIQFQNKVSQKAIVCEPEVNLQETFDLFMQDIAATETVEELKEVFDSFKKTDWKDTDYLKQLIEAKDKRKMQVDEELKKWADTFDAETGEVQK